MQRLMMIVFTIFAGIAVAFFVSCLWTSPETGAGTRAIPRPLDWNTDPGTRVVLATTCCDSPTTEELVRFYIPEAQLWGDGRYLWTERDDQGTRQVFATHLPAAEMAAMLEEIAATGFFTWKEQYAVEPAVDAASQCLTVTLQEGSKTVCAAHGSAAPSAFYALFDRLAHGAGQSGQPYRPQRAYLTGFRLEAGDGPLPAPDVAWPAALAHLPVSEAIAGTWLEDGDGLQSLWQAANRSPYYMPVVAGDDGRYRIILQVPGASWMEPGD